MSIPGLIEMVDRSVGIYGRAPTAYLSALARLGDDFRVAHLDAALERERSLVRIRAMRYSVYTFPLELLAIAVGATRRLVRKMNTQRRALADVHDETSRRVETALADGPMASADLRAIVDPGKDLGSGFAVLLGLMGTEHRIVRATHTGGWRSDRLTYARWQDWVPNTDPDAIDDELAMRELARRYVAAYGPVTIDDLSWWTGWTKTETSAATEGLDLTAAGDAVSLLEGVRLLPVWDVLMVAYEDRDRLFDEEHAPFIYDRMGNATSVVLDGGRVVGIWDLGRSDDPLSVTVAPLGRRWPKRRWVDVEAQAGRIAAMIGAGDVEVIRRDEPDNLRDAPRNRFLSPLSR